MGNEKDKPSVEDVIELSGLEILHPGGMDLTKRIGEIVDMSNRKILDVACGRGKLACYYAKKLGAEVTGVDLSPEMIESSQENAKMEGVENKTQFSVADALSLPYGDNSFDIVINECAVGLTDDPQKCLDEMVRVTKPEGYIIIHESLWLRNLSESEKTEISKRLGNVPYTLSEWKEMLEKAGAVNIWSEDWSSMDKLTRMRPDRKMKNVSDLYSLWEKIAVIMPRVIKRYGITGLLYLNESDKKITPLYYNHTLGYALIKAQKPK